MRRPVLVVVLLAALAGCSVDVSDPPVADAGLDRVVPAGDVVRLAGAASGTDEPFFRWRVVSAPGRHQLQDPTTARPALRVLDPGTYVLALEVFAGTIPSAPDYLQVTALTCDRDGDGARRTGLVCRGADCDDDDPDRSPFARDVCEDGIDQNCDGADEECCPRDEDGDGWVTTLCGGEDCNDHDRLVHPGAFDVCNGKDDDCNAIDDGRDCAPGVPCIDGECGCIPTTEICDDGRDQDCDGADLISDVDGDGHKKIACGGGDCDDDDIKTFPPRNGFPGGDDLCGDGKDQDCDGEDRSLDADGDGFSPAVCRVPGPPDCDDTDPSIHPGAPDLCPDGIDQDCDGQDAVLDRDRDLFPAVECGGTDCDDLDAAIRPTATEICNGRDDDCNGVVDDLAAYTCGPRIGTDPLVDGWVPAWLTLGPIPFQAASACWEDGRRLAGEAAIDPTPMDGALGLRWEPSRVIGGVVDLGTLYAGKIRPNGISAYLFARLDVPASAHYQLRLESSDAAELWLDGERLALPTGALGCDRTAPDVVNLYLTKGLHRLLVRTGTNGGAWRTGLRIVTPRTASAGEDRAASELRVDTGVGTEVGACVAGRLLCDPLLGTATCLEGVGPEPDSCLTPEDEDCDGVTPEPDEDLDGIPAAGCALAGWSGPPDCDDRDRRIGPTMPEICDAGNRDEDCDGTSNDLGTASCGAGPTTFVGPDGHVEDWLVLGPIDTPGIPSTWAQLDPRDLLAAVAGIDEGAVRPFPGEPAGPFAWTKVGVDEPAGGWIDLVEAFPDEDHDRVTRYAYATLWVPEPAVHRVDLRHRGAVSLRVDGQVVLSVPTAGMEAAVQGSLALEAGPHRFLVKLTSTQGTGAAFRLGLTSDGAPATGIGVDLGAGVGRGACLPGTRTCGPDGWSTCAGGVSAVPEKCNGRDDDCDGRLPADEIDADGDGVWPCEGDCDDDDPSVFPGATERCNGRDDDCDGWSDQGPGGVPLPAATLCGNPAAVCEPYGAGCPGSLARCRVTVSCAGDDDCVSWYGTGWRCLSGAACLLCGTR